MIKEVNINGYNCQCALNKESSIVCYMIYPALEPFEEEWLDKMSQDLKVNLVAVYVPADKWNDVLTPWPEPGEVKGYEPFAGKAHEFLKMLTGTILPEVEKECGMDADIKRDLMGVSLGGLFTLWQWMICDAFDSIACLSGSFWYYGFLDWFEKQPTPSKHGKAYFLLGEEEPKVHIKAYRTVGVNTEAIVNALKKDGIPVEFDWVPGNHFSCPVHRAEKALRSLYPPH